MGELGDRLIVGRPASSGQGAGDERSFGSLNVVVSRTAPMAAARRTRPGHLRRHQHAEADRCADGRDTSRVASSLLSSGVLPTLGVVRYGDLLALLGRVWRCRVVTTCRRLVQGADATPAQPPVRCSLL